MKEKDIRLNVSNADNTIFMKVKTVFDKIKLTISTVGIEEYKKQISRYLNQVLEKVQECADYFKIVQQLTSRCQELKNNLETFCYDALTQHSEDSHNPHSVTAEQVNAYTKAQTDSLLATKQAVGNYLTEHQSLSNYYTKSEIDAELDGKSDVNHTHNQYLTEHQSLSNYYTKLETDTAMNSKSNISNTVTTDTAQNITGTKSFVGGNKIILKQNTATSRPGFIITDPNANEVGSLQYKPNAIGTNAMLNLNSPGNTYLGFRYWGTSSNTYNLLMPLPSIANNKFTAGDYYFPLGFTDGTTTIQTAQTGVVDLSGLSFLDSSVIVSSVTSSSTNYKAVGAKLFYDTVGNIETLLQGV